MYSAPSMTSTAGPDSTVFKITLERTKQSETRRIRGSFTFEEFTTAVRHMWNSAPKRLAIEYTDEDGDRILVTSELEWTEAVQQAAERSERVLRLTVRRRADINKKVASDSDLDTDPVTMSPTSPPAAPAAPSPAPIADATCGTAPDVTSAKPLETVSAPAPEEAMPQCRTDSTVADVEAMGEAQSTEGTTDHDNTVDLLSRLYDCDAAKEMQNMFSAVDFSPVVTRRVDAVAHQVVVDVDKNALRHLTITRTNMWIGKGSYEKAETTLEAAMLVWPDQSIFPFNAACSASLRGDLDAAVSRLEAALQKGYRDVQQLKRDPDLENVRCHPKFGQLIKLARGETIEVDDAVPAKKEAEPRSTESDVERLLAVFPHYTTTEAENILKRFGSLTIAVNKLLAA